MSTTDGARPPEQDEEAHVVQIYPRVSQNTGAFSPLQVGARDTVRTVVHNAVVTLGLDPNKPYSLLEVRERGGEERQLEAGECPFDRVLLWPPEAHKWHRQSLGYYFILEQSGKEDCDNLCNLSTLTKESVLDVLRERFYKHKIYTYASKILIAINPNKFLPVYYNPKYVKMYENQPLGKLSPHIFAIADMAFRTMMNNHANQCIVISGERGSGKTESSRYLIHCLTALSKSTYSSGLERAILGAGPVLEAFGNAKTVENNNSSRFGKFIQLHYLASGIIRGAVIEKYLLEKCRLVSRHESERNFHVFYYLLMGASKDEQKEFHLLKPQDYLYLKQKQLLLDDEDKLKQEYKRLHQAMEMVGFLSSTKKHIFSILSAILHLGNVTFSVTEDTQVLEAGPAEVLSTLSDLLKVKKDRLVNTLTMRKVVTADSTVMSQYTLQEATIMRDCMAKSLYGALFDWIIFHINHAMLNKQYIEESASCLSIGILDMFGFENLKKNSFEQLCINYAHETLQQYINQNIFRLEQEDYVAESITWKNIEFTDNSGCIELFRKEPDGLFPLLDKECNLPQATDETLLAKVKQQHQDNRFFLPSSDAESTFVIQHFAGRVEYHITDFRKKNTEHIRPEVISLLRSSERSFLHHLVASSPEALFRWGVLRATIRILTVFKHLGRQQAELMAARQLPRKSLKDLRRRSSAIDRFTSSALDFSFDRSDEDPLAIFEDIFTSHEKRKKIRNGRQKQLIPKNLINLHSLQHVVGVTKHDQSSKSIFHPHRTTKPPTRSAQFQASLRILMNTLEKAEPSFVFCFRANDEKRELHFNDELVLNQIEYSGLLQMIHIQKTGYSAKYTFKEFVENFRILLPKGATATPEEIMKLLRRMEMDENTYQIGKTKVFFKENARKLLQDTLNKEVMLCIITLQRWFRCCLIRLHFLQKRDATMIIQRSWREFYEKQNKAATVIQTAWKSSLKKPKHEHEEQNEGCQPRRDSWTKRGLKRQKNVEFSPNRAQGSDTQRSRSSHTLHRPFSLPLDSKVSSNDSTFSRKDKEGIMEEQTDESSPELRERDDRKNYYQHKGKSMSADELSKFSSSGSDSSPSSKGVSTETDGSRYSLPPRMYDQDSGQQESNQSQITTPERNWFSAVKLLWRRTPKLSPSSELPSDKGATLPSYSSHSYQTSNKSNGRPTRNPTIKISRATRALQCDASLDREITDANELRNLDEFLGIQINELQTRRKDLSATENIFFTATMEFRETIKSMYSVQKPQIGYKDLMKSYHNKVNSLAVGPKQKVEVSLVVNLFQSVLDGFIRGEIKRVESEPAKATKPSKRRRKKEQYPDGPLDHLFSTYQVNIMQSCDLCGSYIWGMERAYMCSACKLICHKKCLSKIITDCSTRVARQDDSTPGSLHFGVQVCVLTSEANPVPKVVEMLLLHVELNGLYTEGLYRKSGSACRSRELHQILQTDPETACLDNYPIHTITGLVKRWLRELPDPLMTFSLYNDFMHAVELPDKNEKIRAVYQKTDELPPSNYNTLERLIFHLVRVAKEEEHNKMSPSSLAIVFAPCILRSPDSDDPFLSMKDVGKIAFCVEILITEQLRRYKEKLQNIQQLEYAEAIAVNQLKLKRQNTVAGRQEEVDTGLEPDSYETEKTLIERIKSIKQEKLDLACTLPDLEQELSDNDNLDSLSSMSSESLDDQLGTRDLEGKISNQSKTQKPDTPHKPIDLAQRVRRLMAQRENEQRTITSGQKEDVNQPVCFLPSHDTPTPTTKPQDTQNTFNGSFDDLDIPYIDENEDLS
ncbi:unconventional myosin-IXb isoform 2-T2 [Pholidichthys leucotaenia]